MNWLKKLLGIKVERRETTREKSRDLFGKSPLRLKERETWRKQEFIRNKQTRLQKLFATLRLN